MSHFVEKKINQELNKLTNISLSKCVLKALTDSWATVKHLVGTLSGGEVNKHGISCIITYVWFEWSGGS